jgi:DNA-binding NarL/FixJ family response regulator
MSILLVDDHQMMREGLRLVLEKNGLEVAGEAASGHEAIALARRLRPEIVVMDISLPGLNGFDATRRLVAEIPKIKIVALTMSSDERYVTGMFEAGAVGYLLKNAASAELVQCVRAVARGLRYVSPAIAAVVIDNLRDRTRPRTSKVLSARQREVLQLLAEGQSLKETARQLDIALPTVETHRRQIMDRLSIRTIAELTKYAIREGLTSLD